MRILGLDYGSKTVGVAVCDPLGMTAQGVETITRKEENKLRKTLARIEALVEEYQVETIVLGYPKNMDDSIGERAQKTEEFRDMLVRRTGLPVVLWDELSLIHIFLRTWNRYVLSSHSDRNCAFECASGIGYDKDTESDVKSGGIDQFPA